MFQRIFLAFAVLALAIVSAETSYKVTLYQPSVVKGTELKAGEYRITLSDQKIVLMNGKTPLEIAAKIETGPEKFSSTTVRLANTDGKYTIAEIRLGGTKTKVVFN
jgi:hypothetical protein